MISPIRIVPPGGWTWQENGFWFDAESPEQLADKVAEYRRNNRRPMGDVRGEVLSKFGFSVAQKLEPSDEFRESVRRWLADVASKEGQKFAVIPEIVKRAAVCAVCPMNVECKDEDIERRVMLVSRGLSLAYPALKACSAHKHHNRVVVLFEEGPKAVEEQHEGCWVK